MQRPCFHLSIPARDVAASADWYARVLGCVPGRRSPVGAILDLAGHQLVLQHEPGTDAAAQPGIYHRHFGLVFDQLDRWRALRDRITSLEEPFRVAPKCRYGGEPLEHWTFFPQDPSGNWLEFKHYRNPEAVLGCREQMEVGDRDLR